MTTRNQIVKWLDKYLALDDVEDMIYNGLQFEGKDEVKKIALAVDACQDTIDAAAREKADMLLVHHGHFISVTNPSLTGWKKKRLEVLFKHNISLYSAHLPLDRHKVVGNNAQILKLLGAKPEEEFAMHEGKGVGWMGRTKKAVSLKAVSRKLEVVLGAKCMVLDYGPKKIQKIAVISGGGNIGDFVEAMTKGADVFITGDQSYLSPLAKDMGGNAIFAGHYATETIGVKAVGDLLEKKFKIETKFIDIPSDL